MVGRDVSRSTLKNTAGEAVASFPHSDCRRPVDRFNILLFDS